MSCFSQIFHPPLSPLSRGSLVPFYFLPLKWYHLHIWGCWYFSWQCWFHYDRKAFKFCHFSGSSFILESFLCHMKLSGNHVDTSLLWICLCPSLFFFKFRIQSEILQCICHVSLFFYHLEMLLSFFFFLTFSLNWQFGRIMAIWFMGCLILWNFLWLDVPLS